MIDLYVICIQDNYLSEQGCARLAESIPTNAYLHNHDAVTETKVGARSKGYGLTWNYPWSGTQLDIKSGLQKSAYPTANPNKRIGCFISHYELWKKCIDLDKPIIVHEHDAIYFNDSPLPLKEFGISGFDIIGLNDPSRATRRSQQYNDTIQSSDSQFVRAPVIDEIFIPQGIAGNSSYWINPNGARHMIHLTKEYGMWPNDALMCRQLVPRLGQSKKYYTYVQGIESTTSL